MGHDHAHGAASAGMANRRRLVVVLGLSIGVLVVEVVGAAVTGSLALLADAGHVLTDVAGVTLAIAAVTFAARPPSPARTFGYYRLEILAAVVNGVLLLGVAGFILVEAWRRWSEPPDVHGGPMLVFAVVGLAANVVALLILSSGAKESLNVKGAYLEVLGDALGSIAVIAAAVVIALTGWERADIVASVLVAAMILPRTYTLLREAVDVLLEATPKGIDLAELRAHILAVPGVVGAHDLHVWVLTSGMPVMSAHVVVEDSALTDGSAGRILDQLGECLGHHFDVEHCTFQIEPSGHAEHEHPSHA
jgi:cobalt-zinc-cadmium efflux system protein